MVANFLLIIYFSFQILDDEEVLFANTSGGVVLPKGADFLIAHCTVSGLPVDKLYGLIQCI